MTKDIDEIRHTLIEILQEFLGDLKVTIDTEDRFEVTGTVEAMQGKKKVDGIYFASVVPKPRDVRFYFFPIYTHKEEMGELEDNLVKCLKGKSCFHVKYMDDELKKSFSAMVRKSIGIFKEHGLL